MIRFQREMMFPGMNTGKWGNGCMGVDIKESADEYVFDFELPGTLKDDVKIWFEGNVLTVSGEKRDLEKEGQKKIHSERAYGKFERSFRMPDGVDGNSIKAEFVNGILVVTVPKSEKAKPVEVKIN